MISVIVPVYNLEKYVSCTLDSILGQTFSDIEIIVVNDGSSDRTKEILDDYATRYPNKIKVFHILNGGVTNARLVGVKHATGEWIGFVDGDDYVEPEMYEILLQNALKYNVDISHCGYKMVFPNGRCDFYYNTGRIIEQDNLQGLEDLLSGTIVEPGLWNKLYKKKLFHDLLENNLMDTSIKINEDLLMNYYLFKNSNKSVFQDVCLYHYLVRDGSAANSTLNENKLKDPLKVLDIILADIEDAKLQSILENRVVRQLISVAILPLGTQKQLIAPYRKEIRNRLRKCITKVLSNANISIKFKGMALWASLWPMSYYLVHKIYAKLTGLDKKYSLE